MKLFRSTVLQLGILLGLTLVAGSATKLFHPAAPDLRLSAATAKALKDEFQVTLTDISERWDDDVFWVDSRTEDEFEAGHVRNALHLGDDIMNTITRPVSVPS